MGSQWGLTLPLPNPPASKFALQSDPCMKTDAQIKFLYYPLDFVWQIFQRLLQRIIPFAKL